MNTNHNHDNLLGGFNVSISARQYFQYFLDRYAVNVARDELQIESDRSLLVSFAHDALDQRLNIHLIPLLAGELEAASCTQPNPFGFLRQIAEEPSFSACLTLILNHYGWAPYRASRIWGLNNPTFNFWVRGRRGPKTSGLPMLQRFAAANGLPVELLKAKVAFFKYGKVTLLRNRTAHGLSQSELVRKQYLLVEWPERLQKQWDLLFEHKTEFHAAGYARNEIWRADSKGHSETAETNRMTLNRFFGFLVLAPNPGDPQLDGLGFCPEDLTLGLLTDSDLILGFLNFQQARARKINRGQRLIIQIVSALIRPLTGLVWQIPDWGNHAYLVAKHGSDIVKKTQWRLHCQKTHLKIKDKRNFLEQTRSYAEPCNREKTKRILAYQNPSNCLFVLTERMLKDAPPKYLQDITIAVYKRNFLLHECLKNNPLRVSHLVNLTYRADNSGQLRKQGDTYYICIDPSQFKAWSHSLNSVYEAPFPPDMTPFFDEYLNVWRPFLADAGTCDFVFRPNPKNEKGTVNAPLQYDSISSILRKISVRYIPEYTHGLSAHDYRHILATTLVKNVGNGIELASLLLHVSREMIDEHYGHYRDSKEVGAIQNLIAKSRDIWNSIKAA